MDYIKKFKRISSGSESLITSIIYNISKEEVINYIDSKIISNNNTNETIINFKNYIKNETCININKIYLVSKDKINEFNLTKEQIHILYKYNKQNIYYKNNNRFEIKYIINLFTDFDFIKALEINDNVVTEYNINSTKKIELIKKNINSKTELLEILNNNVDFIYGESKFLDNLSTNVILFNKKLSNSEIVKEYYKKKNINNNIQLEDLLKNINSSDKILESNEKDKFDYISVNNGIIPGKSNLENGGFGVFAKKDFDVDDIVEVVPFLLLPVKDTNNEMKNYVLKYDKNNSSLPLGYGNLYNHRNEPNIIYSYSKSKDFIIYKANMPIKSGDELFICYENDWFIEKSLNLTSNLISILSSNSVSLQNKLDNLNKKNNLVQSISSTLQNISNNLLTYDKGSYNNNLIIDSNKYKILDAESYIKDLLCSKSDFFDGIILEENTLKFVNNGVTSGKSNLKNAGSGAFATKNFDKDEIVEVVPIIKIPLKDADNVLDCYIFKYDSVHCAFALGYGNLYNHQDNSNVAYKFDIEKKFLIYKTTKSLQKGEELFINYGVDYWMNKGFVPENID